MFFNRAITVVSINIVFLFSPLTQAATLTPEQKVIIKKNEERASVRKRFQSFIHRSGPQNDNPAQLTNLMTQFSRNFSLDDLEVLASYFSELVNGVGFFDLEDPAFLHSISTVTFLEALHNLDYDKIPTLTSDCNELENALEPINPELFRKVGIARGFYDLIQTPSISKEIMLPIIFALAKNYFDNTSHLVSTLKQFNYNSVKIDNYRRNRYLRTIMYNYFLRALYYEEYRSSPALTDFHTIPDNTPEGLMNRISYLVDKIENRMTQDKIGFMLQTALQGNLLSLISDDKGIVAKKEQVSRKKRKGRNQKGANRSNTSQQYEEGLKEVLTRLTEGFDLLTGLAEGLESRGKIGAAGHVQQMAAEWIVLALITDIPHPLPTLLGSHEAVRNPKETIQKFYLLNRVIRYLDKTRLTNSKIYNTLIPYYTDTAVQLINRLKFNEFEFMSIDEKFEIFDMCRRAIDDGFFDEISGGVEGHPVRDLLMKRIFTEGVLYSSSRSAEKDFITSAYDALPEVPEDKSLFDFYFDMYKSELGKSTPGRRGRQKKMQRNENWQIKTALIRVQEHLEILIYAGKIDEFIKLANQQTKITDTQRKRPSQEARIRAIKDKIEAQRQANQDAEEKLQEALKRQEERSQAREKEAQKRKEKQGDSVSFNPFWDSRDKGPSITAQAKREAAARIERDAQKASLKADRVDNCKSGVSSPLDAGSVHHPAQIVLPEKVISAVRKHRKTFDALFSDNDNPDIRRSAFLSFILDLGGTHEVNKGSGSHQFISFKLGDNIVDTAALTLEEVTELERHLVKAKSSGTMTISLPGGARGHKTQFLLYEQAKNARMLLIASGVTPSIVDAQ